MLAPPLSPEPPYQPKAGLIGIYIYILRLFVKQLHEQRASINFVRTCCGISAQTLREARYLQSHILNLPRFLRMATEKCCQPLCNVEGTVGKELVLIQAADAIKGTVRQTRCRQCNNGMGRLRRFLKEDIAAKADYTELSVEGKSKFMAKVSSQGLAGDNLKKVLSETVSWTRVQKQSANFSAQGTFKSEKALREDPELDPDTVQALLRNSPNMECQVTLETLYWRPTYSMGHENREEATEVRKRMLESEEIIKAKKKPNVKVERVNQPAAADADAIDVELPPAQKTRLEKCVPKIEQQQHQLLQQLATVKAPEREGQVGSHVLKKAEKTNKTLEQIVEQSRGIIDANKCKKGEDVFAWELVRSATTWNSF